jgi:hypothetical protein
VSKEQSRSEQPCREHVSRDCPGTGNKCARNTCKNNKEHKYIHTSYMWIRGIRRAYKNHMYKEHATKEQNGRELTCKVP